MKKPLHLIYITGLGDARVGGQRKAINTWRWYGVRAELFQVNWGDKQAWQPKFEQLLARIDTIVEEGGAVGLVAVSAGASAAINAYEARKHVVTGVVLIAGKVNNPGTIGSNYRRNNPAFVDSAYACEQALQRLTPHDRSRILSRYGLIDELVSGRDSIISCAHNRRSPTIGHVMTIAAQITVGAPSFIRFLRKQT